MADKTFKLNGKEFTGHFNASGELSQTVEGLEDSVIRDLPAKSSPSGSCVYRKVDGDQWIKIGNHFMTSDEKAANRASHAGNGTGASATVKKTNEMLDELVKVIRPLVKKDSLAEFDDFIKAKRPVDKGLENAKKALAGMDLEQIKELLGL